MGTEYVERHLAGVGSNEHSKEEVKSEEDDTSSDENNNKANIKREQDHKWFVHLIKDLVQIQKNEDEQREKEEQARKIAMRRKKNITDEDGGKWWKKMKDNEQLDEDDKKEKWMTKGEKDKKRRKQLKKMKKALEKKIAKEQEALRPKEIEEKLRDTKKSKADENGNIVEKKSKKKDKKDKVPKPGTSSGSGSSEDKSSSSSGSENEDDIGASCDYIIDNLPKCKDPVQEGDGQRYLENALRPMHKKKNELSVKHYKSYSTTQHYKNVVKERNDFDSNDFELIEAKDCKENVCTFCNA